MQSAAIEQAAQASHCCADNGVPGPLKLVVVSRQELAVAHLQIHHVISQLGHIHPRGAPSHLNDASGTDTHPA